MKNFLEINKDEVLAMVAEGTEVRAVILSDQEVLTKGMNSSMKEQIIRLTTKRSIQEVNDVISQENVVFYIKTEGELEE